MFAMNLFRYSSALTLFLISICPFTLAKPTVKSIIPRRSLPLPVHVVHEFPKGTWVENLAIRKNDQILTTFVTAPEIYQVDPLSIYEPILIYTFPYTSTLGITEVEDDLFYVAMRNITLTTLTPIPGSWAVWEVNMTSFSTHNPAKARKIADLPNAVLLNGMTLLNKSKRLVLIADSVLGIVWRLDGRTGKVSKAIDDPSMKAPPGSSSPIAINGVEILPGSTGTLYFSNSAAGTLNSISIHADGSAKAPAMTVVLGLFIDDFLLDGKGNAYLNLNDANSEAKLKLEGAVETVLAGSPQDKTTLAGPTACRFRRTKLNGTNLYISTNGGTAGYRTGNFTVGGRISRIDLDGYYR